MDKQVSRLESKKLNEFNLKTGEVSKEPVREAGELGPGKGQTLKQGKCVKIVATNVENVAKKSFSCLPNFPGDLVN